MTRLTTSIPAATSIPADPAAGSGTSRRPRGERARQALVDAAVRLLPERSPTMITGRELAAEAGLNYGLVHHYFGGKDAVLMAGLSALREDFVATHGDVAQLHLLVGDGHPYFRAMLRSQIDYPNTVTPAEFPNVAAMVSAVTERLQAQRGALDGDGLAEARARAIAMVSIQVCVSVFGDLLHDMAGVEPAARGDVEAALGRLYDALGCAPT